MFNFEKIKMISGMASSMVKEAMKSEDIKASKKNVKEALDGILNSEEVGFIKMGIQASDKYKIGRAHV